MAFLDSSRSDTFWRSLRYFNYYRLAIGFLLATFARLQPTGLFFLDLPERRLYVVTCYFYLGFAAVSLLVVRLWRRQFNWQLSIQVLVDIGAITMLVFASGGLRSGVGILMFVSLAAAGLIGRGRLVLFYAAVASIAILLQHVYQATQSDIEQVSFFQAGMFCTGFFATAITARLLARRVVITEDLARQRGLALRRQVEVSEQVIAQMQDGVLVASTTGDVQQINPKAREFLGAPDDGRPVRIAEVAPGLAQALVDWLDGDSPNECEFRALSGGRLVHARFVPVGDVPGETLVFLEDVGHQRELAQQLKLAALGRLTANIAHEIRNPLSSIQHAAELIREAGLAAEEERLVRIVIDNTHRLERIVSDVLQIGRRDRAHREIFDLSTFLPILVDEWRGRNRLSAESVRVVVDPDVSIEFDRSHLTQVLLNLLENAHRHGRGRPGSVQVLLESSPATYRLHVLDDGDGIPAGLRGQVFEPFFTTHVKGTGLGLYIARELCEANGARLELMENSPGGHFCIQGGMIHGESG